MTTNQKGVQMTTYTKDELEKEVRQGVKDYNTVNARTKGNKGKLASWHLIIESGCVTLQVIIALPDGWQTAWNIAI